MSLNDIYLYMEPYDYDYRGQGFYVHPYRDFSNYREFEKQMIENINMFGPTVEEWEVVDTEGKMVWDLATDNYGLKEEAYDAIKEFFSWCADNKVDTDAASSFVDLRGHDVTDDIENFLDDNYRGQFDSMLEYAYELLDDIGIDKDLAENYFDFDKLGYSLKVSGDLDMLIMEDWEDRYDTHAEAQAVYDEMEDMADDRLGEWYVYDLIGDLESAMGDRMGDYFDYKKFARDLEYDYEYIDGTIWSNN